MTTLANPSSSKRRLLLASDRNDRSSELAGILQSVGEVDTISTSDIPEAPDADFSGIVVDINLRSPESVQQVRSKLRADAYRSVPRLFVLADNLHHGSMQAWALGATDTIGGRSIRTLFCNASAPHFRTPSGLTQPPAARL